MKNLKNIRITNRAKVMTTALIVFLGLGLNSVSAQTGNSGSGIVTARLVRGLVIEATGANSLNFGEVIVSNNSQTKDITPENGQKFLAVGHPDRNVSFNYDNAVILSNEDWVNENGGTVSAISFNTSTAKQTGARSTYENAQDLTNGETVTLVNDNGDGKMFVWVGGQLGVDAQQPQGDYKGTLNISVTY
jgi:hypothetical protein